MLRKITTLLFIFPLLLGQVCCYVHAHRDSAGSAVGLAASHVHLVWDGSSQGHVHRGHRHGSHRHSHSKHPNSKSDSQNDGQGKAFDASAEYDYAVFGLMTVLVPPSSWNDSGVSPEQDMVVCCRPRIGVELRRCPTQRQPEEFFALSAALYLRHCSLRL